MSKTAPLFPRLDATAPPPCGEPVSSDSPEAEDGDGLITYDQFMNTKLRTAKIMAAEKVEGTAKLLRLEVMMGEERRQLVAGIALHYEPDELIGKTIVVVANLQPARIRGVDSEGMLLASGADVKLPRHYMVRCAACYIMFDPPCLARHLGLA